MNISIFGTSAIFSQPTEEQVKGKSITIGVDGVEEGTQVSIVKNGKKETEFKCIVHNNSLILMVEAARYTIDIDGCKVRFTVYEKDGGLFVKRAKEDGEKAMQTLLEAYRELSLQMQQIKTKIDNLTGYDVVV